MKRRTLAMLLYSPSVMIAANGKEPIWNNCAGWLSEYCIPVRRDRIVTVEHDDGKLRELTFERGNSLTVDAAFTTRGDRYHNDLAERSGGLRSMNLGRSSSIRASRQPWTASMPRAVSPRANCQVIIAAGQGAAAAEAINRDFFDESLQTHTLRCFGQPEGAGHANGRRNGAERTTERRRATREWARRIALRITAVADLHCPRTPGETSLFADLAGQADVILLSGDLTDYGRPERIGNWFARAHCCSGLNT